MSNSELKRCEWCEKDDLYRSYHDNEWGVVSHDDGHLFEHLILETFQAGLSWHTILKKREPFRRAFDGFDATLVSQYGESDVERLLRDEGIIRNKAKINAAINNARCFLTIQKEQGSFDRFIWSFAPEKHVNEIRNWDDVVATTPESDAMSKALKKQGFKFVGSTTCYAFMQAVGMVDDHFDYCWKKHQ